MGETGAVKGPDPLRSWLLSVAMLFLAATGSCPANVCVYKPPKVRQLHGVVLDMSTEPIPGAVVALGKGAEIVKKSITSDDGEFDLGSMPDGRYKIHTVARGFIDSWYEVVLQNQTDQWKRAINIKLAVGMDQCDGSISIVEKAATKR